MGLCYIYIYIYIYLFLFFCCRVKFLCKPDFKVKITKVELKSRPCVYVLRFQGFQRLSRVENSVFVVHYFVIFGCFFGVLPIGFVVKNLLFLGSVSLKRSVFFGHPPLSRGSKNGRFEYTFAAGVWGLFAVAVCLRTHNFYSDFRTSPLLGGGVGQKILQTASDNRR